MRELTIDYFCSYQLKSRANIKMKVELLRGENTVRPPKISVFLTCRDRVSYLEEVIESILRQEYKDFELIISDNSVGNEVSNLIAIRYPTLKYRRRNSVDALKHFNQIIEEIDTEYLVIFHDDDVLLPGYLSGMITALTNHPNVAAVGCNAFITWETEPSDVIFAQGITHSILITTPDQLFEYYMDIDKRFHAPFPSYMYRTAFVQSLRFNAAEGGKYADVSFLMKIVKLAPILWIPDIFMQYRFHLGNDRNIEDIKGKLSLLRFVLATTCLTKKSRAVDVYRAVYLARWIMPRLKVMAFYRSRRMLVVMRYLISRVFNYPFPLLLSQGVKKMSRLLKCQ